MQFFESAQGFILKHILTFNKYIKSALKDIIANFALSQIHQLVLPLTNLFPWKRGNGSNLSVVHFPFNFPGSQCLGETALRKIYQYISPRGRMHRNELTTGINGVKAQGKTAMLEQLTVHNISLGNPLRVAGRLLWWRGPGQKNSVRTNLDLVCIWASCMSHVAWAFLSVFYIARETPAVPTQAFGPLMAFS